MASRTSKVIGMVMVLGLILMAGTFLVVLLDEISRQGDAMVGAGLIGLIAMSWLVFRGPVGKAIAGLLEDGKEHDPMLGVRLADVEDRLQEISLETQRLMEIEDRLDFTERLLAQHYDPGRLLSSEES